ncbi:hypothetical protein OIU85_011886 [Salix viminalis]|uniref:Uncharacterized protein n=1 Tax=Salix viminalis TaxID=40686 RepID=A0A9Q0NTW5_SALVM|nr:hypothetical protein OIU85_011886 [Salix viminalis]
MTNSFKVVCLGVVIWVATGFVCYGLEKETAGAGQRWGAVRRCRVVIVGGGGTGFGEMLLSPYIVVGPLLFSSSSSSTAFLFVTVGRSLPPLFHHHRSLLFSSSLFHCRRRSVIVIIAFTNHHCQFFDNHHYCLTNPSSIGVFHRLLFTDCHRPIVIFNDLHSCLSLASLHRSSSSSSTIFIVVYHLFSFSGPLPTHMFFFNDRQADGGSSLFGGAALICSALFRIS